MHVDAVADDFRGDFVGLQHGADQTRRAMAERRHPVEEVRGLARAGVDRGERFFVGRTRMAQRHAMPARRQPAHQIEAAVQLRRERHDADVRRRALDLGEDVGGGEVGSLG